MQKDYTIVRKCDPNSIKKKKGEVSPIDLEN